MRNLATILSLVLYFVLAGGAAFAQNNSNGNGSSLTGGGLQSSGESVGGGLETPQATSGVAGGGLEPVNQNNVNTGQGQTAPNGQSYRSLGISGY
jgi:hypothetical protein